ncbi:MAG: glycosyl hydrolase family 79 C-terminal domain-containing protein [Acidobacteriaceae bacterium]
MSSVATPGLLSVHNRRYLELVRGLGPSGVLRVGGIVANYTRYAPEGQAGFAPENTRITRASIEQFALFLERVGWTAIWSLNFAQGTLPQAIEEARSVAQILGPRLLALEIGNEVDSYGSAQPFRPPSWNYAAYLKEFELWQGAIAKAVPGIRFAAPDTASSVDWVERMARDAPDKVQLLATHYYRNGQAHGSAEQLLTSDPRLEDIAARLRAASRHSGIPWRICEINSFSGGGRPGVSNTFVGALWTLKVMLFLAQAGCSGVNLETGVNQLGFVSSYSPIQDNGRGINSAGVPYYGMLAFTRAFAGCQQMLPLETIGEDSSLAAYVFAAKGKPRSVAVVNTHFTLEADLSVAGLGMKHASILRLLAPHPSSTAGVTFGGASVDDAGTWRAIRDEAVHREIVSVPAMSAAILVADPHRVPAPA